MSNKKNDVWNENLREMREDFFLKNNLDYDEDVFSDDNGEFYYAGGGMEIGHPGEEGYGIEPGTKTYLPDELQISNLNYYKYKK